MAERTETEAEKRVPGLYAVGRTEPEKYAADGADCSHRTQLLFDVESMHCRKTGRRCEKRLSILRHAYYIGKPEQKQTGLRQNYPGKRNNNRKKRFDSGKF